MNAASAKNALAPIKDVIHLQNLLLNMSKVENTKDEIFNFLLDDISALKEEQMIKSDHIKSKNIFKQFLKSLSSWFNSRPLNKDKLFEFLTYLSDAINQMFTKREIMNIFKSKTEKEILLKLKLIDDDFLSLFEKNDNIDFPFFIPEHQVKSNDKSNNEIMNKVKLIIQNDSVDDFEMFISENQKFNLNSRVDIGLCYSVSLVEYSALNGSNKIFHYLVKKGVNLIPKLIKKYSIMGNCLDIIQEVHAENETKLKVKYNFFDPKQNEFFTDSDIAEAIRAYNVGLVCDMIDKAEDILKILAIAVKFDHQDIVEYMIKERNIDFSSIGQVCAFYSAENGNEDLFNFFKKDINDSSFVPTKQIMSDLFQKDEVFHENTDSENINQNDESNEPTEAFISPSFPIDEERESILHKACRGGSLQITKEVFEHDSKALNSSSKSGDKPLHLAVRFNNIEIVRFLVVKLKENIDINLNNQDANNFENPFLCRDNKKLNPLHLAVRGGYLEIIEILSEAFPPALTSLSRYNLTPLLLAAHEGRTQSVKYILSKLQQIEPNAIKAKDKKMNNALLLAVHWNHPETAIYLSQIPEIEKNEKDFYGQTAIIASFSKKMYDLTRTFCKNPEFDVNVKDARQKSLLHLAVLSNDMKMVKFLVDECGSRLHIEAHDRHRITPFVAAINNENIDIAGFLFNHGADVNSRGEDNWTAMHFAAKRNNMKGLEFLITLKNVNIEARANFGLTPLYLAAFNGKIEATKFLIEKAKAKVMTRDDRNCTILHAAASSNQPEMVEFLITISSIDINAINDDGMTALHLAARENFEEIVKMLVSSGRCDISIVDNDGLTAYQYLNESNQESLHDTFEKAATKSGKGCNIC